MKGRLASTFFAALIVLVLVAAGAFGLPAFTTWPKSSTGKGGQAELFDIATGCHTTYDRFVIDARSATPGYDVRYVDQVFADPSGQPVSLLGRKRIRVVIRPARGVMDVTTDPLSSVILPACPNLRHVRTVGNFEGTVSFGLGLRRMTGFRVFRLTHPARVVVDIAH